MLGLRADIEFLWGFQCKIPGLSKSSPSFTYPPPTVILGALAEALAKEYHIGEEQGKGLMPLLSAQLLAIGLRPVNCVPIKFSDINKVIAIRRTGEGRYPNPEDPYGSFDAPSMGKTILAPLDGRTPLLRLLLVFDEPRMTLGAHMIELNEDALWRIHRLGSKESRVSVVEVERSDNTKAMEGRVEVMHSHPLLDGIKLGQVMQPSWIQESLIDPFSLTSYDENENPVRNYLEGKKILRFALPLMMTPKDAPSRITYVSKPAAWYEVGGEVVIGRWPRH